MKIVRKFLKKNEIYFTTITALFLSLMAIVVTYNSNQIAKQQIELSYNENKPDFNISGYYIRNLQSGMAEEYEMTVSKYGGKAKNININTVSYITLEFQDSLRVNFENKFLLRFYLDSNFGNSNNTGIITTIKGYENNKRYSELVKEIEKRLKEKGYKYVFNKCETYIKIEYLDFSEKRNTEVYKLRLGDGLLIKNYDEDIFGNSIYKKVIDLDELNRLDINEIIERIITTANTV
ncbi:hypothetical protein F7644_12070 [Tenacibaculum finnmarkense genomovar ulcerans]|uniref:hypothetical protein n=1 Tax=Tenacibaculum finnmarkense TaxID=2781243 RepID=UPI00187B6901|nr:hypothetical protein [Tenacibaculum finnmarkense]MBE7646715.1 hypothetical protein [Tenacibaculum finnmarkense genomovar ulcerans]